MGQDLFHPTELGPPRQDSGSSQSATPESLYIETYPQPTSPTIVPGAGQLLRNLLQEKQPVQFAGGPPLFGRGRERQERRERRESRHQGGGLFEGLFAGAGGSHEKIDDMGVIDELKLPKGMDRSGSEETPSFSKIEYSDRHSPTAKLSYYSWDKNPLPQETVQQFKELLDSKMPGQIADEQTMLKAYMLLPAGFYSYSGAMDDASTNLRIENIRGKNVLIMENRGNQDAGMAQAGAADPNWRGVTMVIPADDYRFQYTLSFEGHEHDFKRHWKSLSEEIGKIEWQSTPREVRPPNPLFP